MLGKKILKQFDIKEEVMYADIQWDDVLKIVSNQKTKYSPISKFPTVKRDLALVLNNEVTYEAIRVSAKKELKNLLLDINLFDLYKGEKVSNNKKSMAISFTLGDENKTLADKEIEKLMLRLISVFEKEFGAEIRS
jgi:phenylalanyl-tRNA synthetase beta chain